MYSVGPKIERENLFQEILNVLRQWPERDRRVFWQAHYEGQSVEAISRSLQLGEKEVSAVLLKCDDRLHASLGSFRKCDRGKPSCAA
jgi:DNA-directed RNA polymerase specialized sigma24 family protein